MDSKKPLALILGSIIAALGFIAGNLPADPPECPACPVCNPAPVEPPPVDDAPAEVPESLPVDPS